MIELMCELGKIIKNKALLNGGFYISDCNVVDNFINEEVFTLLLTSNEPDIVEARTYAREQTKQDILNALGEDIYFLHEKIINYVGFSYSIECETKTIYIL